MTLCNANWHFASLWRSSRAALVCLVLAGCAANPVPPSQIDPPSARLMALPAALPKLAEGDDLVQAHASLRASYGRETGKLRSLQGYVKTLLGKRAAAKAKPATS